MHKGSNKMNEQINTALKCDCDSSFRFRLREWFVSLSVHVYTSVTVYVLCLNCTCRSGFALVNNPSTVILPFKKPLCLCLTGVVLALISNLTFRNIPLVSNHNILLPKQSNEAVAMSSATPPHCSSLIETMCCLFYLFPTKSLNALSPKAFFQRRQLHFLILRHRKRFPWVIVLLEVKSSGLLICPSLPFGK